MANKFLQRIINYILERRRQKLEKTINKLKPRTYTNSSNKTHINASEVMTLTTQTDKILDILDEEVKNIVKACQTNPENLLSYVQQHGTDVFKIPYADIVLSKIGEEEGFIVPLNGLKALYLNFLTSILNGQKMNISFKTKEMFVLRDMKINVYYMLHQFHKWYAFKKDLPGFDEKAQTLFKENLNKMTDGKELSIEEIIALKEAIARDAQAAEFVVQLAKENDGVKNALNKIKNDGSAEI